MVSPSSCLAQLPGAIFHLASYGFMLDMGSGELVLRRSYNGEFDRLKAELRQLHAGEKELISYRTTLLLLFRYFTFLNFSLFLYQNCIVYCVSC